jgi:hypothetical protein
MRKFDADDLSTADDSPTIASNDHKRQLQRSIDAVDESSASVAASEGSALLQGTNAASELRHNANDACASGQIAPRSPSNSSKNHHRPQVLVVAIRIRMFLLQLHCLLMLQKPKQKYNRKYNQTTTTTTAT